MWGRFVTCRHICLPNSSTLDRFQKYWQVENLPHEAVIIRAWRLVLATVIFFGPILFWGVCCGTMFSMAGTLRDEGVKWNRDDIETAWNRGKASPQRGLGFQPVNAN